jgi:phosphoglycerate kinase
MKGGEVLLLENTRFHVGETKADPTLSSQLGRLADVFVMDAFGASHRNHSSTAGVCEHMKHSAAGFLMEKELKYLKGAIDEPVRPLCAIVGGAKVSTKIPVIESLIGKCDTVLIGGGMIFTFYKAMGYEVGASLVEEDMIPLASKLMKLAEEKGVKMVLPTDVVIADRFDNDATTRIVNVAKDGISDGWLGLDIGPSTSTAFGQEIEACQTIIWNGPMGVFELPSFATGTKSIANLMATSTKRGATTIVGGGDSVAAVNCMGLGAEMSHISTGGGASLELLEGKVLAGVDALDEV